MVREQGPPTIRIGAGPARVAVRVVALGEVASVAASRPYALLGSAARLFALIAVLLQAASAVVDRVLALTWASSGGPAQGDMSVSGFTCRERPSGIAAVAGAAVAHATHWTGAPPPTPSPSRCSAC